MNIPLLSPVMFNALFRADLANIARDPLLAGGAVMSVLPGLLLLVFGSRIDAAALDGLGIAGLSYILAGIALMMPGAILGWIYGFLLLEDRDDNVLMAIEITPLGKTGFIVWRLASVFALAFTLNAVMAPLMLPGNGAIAAVGLVILASLHALTTALFLLAFAANKVEGLALTKLVNIALLAPLLALLPAPWRWLAAPIPPFWLGEMLAFGENPLPMALAFGLGLIATLAVISLLCARTRKRVG
jgi:fluoroquinolone transport system permease protein